MRNCYRFSDCATEAPPNNQITSLLDKAFSDEKLTRADKNRMAEILYGSSTMQSSIYRLAGWAWPMFLAKQFREIVVQDRYSGQWRSYWAPDKTALRSVLGNRRMAYLQTRK
jgi:hypothetical protein